MANNAVELQHVVNVFIQHNQKITFQGGPYCDNFGHYQAVIIEEKQQLNG